MIIYKNEVELNLRFPFKIERYVLNKQDNTKESFHWHSFFEITFIESGIGNYFSSYFKKITECTFSNYLSGIRVRQAQKLLNTSEMGIAQITLECGFNNISNFYRIYKNFTGKNPGDERNRTHKTKQEM